MTLWTPASLAAPPKVWLDASVESTGASATWTDQSGNGNSVTQGTAGNRPVVTAAQLGGLNGMVFTRASSHFMTKSAPSGISDNNFTAFAIWSHGYSAANDETCFSVYDGSYPDTLLAFWGASSLERVTTLASATANRAAYTPPNGSFHLASVVHTTTLREYFENGTSKDTNTTSQGVETVNFFEVGARLNGLGDFLDGVICELLYFTGTMSTADRQRVEGYLSWKFSQQAWLPADHPYKNAAPAFIQSFRSPVRPMLHNLLR